MLPPGRRDEGGRLEYLQVRRLRATPVCRPDPWWQPCQLPRIRHAFQNTVTCTAVGAAPHSVDKLNAMPFAFRIVHQGPALAVAACLSLVPAAAGGQPPGVPAMITIPYLANDSKPQDLDFAAAQCQRTPDGREMTCHMRQVFVTVASHDTTSCVITTNGYDLTFSAVTATRWVHRSAPEGACGVVETTTLDDGGTTHWTMSVSRAATRDLSRAECRAAAGAPPEVYSWKNVQRPLPCRTIQPGAIER